MQVRLSRKQESSNLVGVQLYRNVDPEKRLYFKYLFMSIHNTEHNCNQNWYFSVFLRGLLLIRQLLPFLLEASVEVLVSVCYLFVQG